ncbi:hypothetical protein QYE76_016604 [Lolium multiflorum]|uniref:Uncharacterized protein n=1 Tax=Lolium multiflorum TaxID=4521 RepID=A0AAD8PHL1_LOLMU|nr:hypothetical protein QYE76_016604 [Lolium multiflorum]
MAESSNANATVSGLKVSDILLPHPSLPNSLCLGPRTVESPAHLISCEAHRIPFVNQNLDLTSWADCLRAWPNPPEDWVSWYSRVSKTYQSTWETTGIADALSLSLSPLEKHENLLKTIGYFWSDALNCFMFGHGPMTPTLLDVTSTEENSSEETQSSRRDSSSGNSGKTTTQSQPDLPPSASRKRPVPEPVAPQATHKEPMHQESSKGTASPFIKPRGFSSLPPFSPRLIFRANPFLLTSANHFLCFDNTSSGGVEEYGCPPRTRIRWSTPLTRSPVGQAPDGDHRADHLIIGCPAGLGRAAGGTFMSITLGAATKLLDDMMINYSEWHTERAPQGKKVNSVEETSSLSDKIDVIMSMLVNGRSNVDPNNVPLASLVAQEENVDVNFIKNNNFNNNAYGNNSGNNYRPYPSANGNGYGNSYGNSYNNNRSVPSGLEAMLKEFISTQIAFNKSVEEKLDKIDTIASRVDRRL